MVGQYLIDIVERVLAERLDVARNYHDSEFKALIESCVSDLGKRTHLSEAEKKEIVQAVFDARRKLGILQPLLDDPEVNEIMINGTDGIYIERGGQVTRYEKRYTDAGVLFNAIQSMVSWVNRSVNESSPIVDARLADGSRVNVVLKPVALNGPAVTIRKFSDRVYTMEDFVANGTVSEDEADFLSLCVRARANIFVSGGTSSGKTTLLNVLAGKILPEERIVTIEDSAELRLAQPNLVRLETKNQNSEGKGAISMRALIKAALRMRPDRILVGEVRDESALDMLQAMCTGHDGSMSTAHSNSAEDILTRIETMALWEGHINAEAIRKQIASGIDLIVHMQRGADMRRCVAEIAEVTEYRDGKVLLRSLYRGGKRTEAFEMKEGKLCEKIRQSGEGLSEIPG